MAGRSATIEEVQQFRPCWQIEDVSKVLDILSRLGQRVGKHHLRQRRHDRKPYTATVFVAPRKKGADKQTRPMLPVMARDLSRSGMSLLAPALFELDIEAPNPARLRAENVLYEKGVLDIGLRKDTGDMLWVYGTVVRVCTVQHDYLDVGIQFNGRHNLALEFDFI